MEVESRIFNARFFYKVWHRHLHFQATDPVGHSVLLGEKVEDGYKGNPFQK